MTQTFSPRETEQGAWKTWYKDGAKLLGRLGMGWILLWCAGLPLFTYLVASPLLGTPFFLLALLGMQMIGVFLQPVLQHTLDQASDGKGVSINVVMSMVGEEIYSSFSWFRSRMIGQIFAYAFMLIFIFSIVSLHMLGDQEDIVRETKAQWYSGMSTLMLYLIGIPTVLRKFGFFDFSYWLRARMGMEQQISTHMHYESSKKNNKNLAPAIVLMLAVYIIISSMSLVALFLLPVFHWYHAAVTRCAYKDIFEGGTGLKETQNVKVENHIQSPVLQA